MQSMTEGAPDCLATRLDCLREDIGKNCNKSEKEVERSKLCDCEVEGYCYVHLYAGSGSF